jgi:hypothetical protein
MLPPSSGLALKMGAACFPKLSICCTVSKGFFNLNTYCCENAKPYEQKFIIQERKI